MKIIAIKMDITKIGEKADVIVNAANESLLGGGGVDYAIHKAAGKELLEECRTLNGCRPGEAKVTKAYNLKNKYIIHTVGPRYYSNPHPNETLASCYLNSLRIADELELETIAFSSISTGVFSFPLEKAAEICAKVVCSYNAKHLKQAYMCIYSNDERSIQTHLEIYNKAFEKYSK
ncbi:MAG: macro domain-containing protein [Bacilli bacterium]